MRNRSVALVVRNKKILMEKLHCDGRTFFALPGGGIESGETPEQAVLRELKEECGLVGTVIRKLVEIYNNDRTEYAFEVSVTEDQQVKIGYDPEVSADEQIIRDVLWLELHEISEKDRAYLWKYGLLEVNAFAGEVLSWGDEISYPKEQTR